VPAEGRLTLVRTAEVVDVLLAKASVAPALLLTRSSTSRFAPGVLAPFTKVATLAVMRPERDTFTAKTSKSVLRSMMPVAIAVPAPLSVSARAAAMVLPWSSVR
jgi:hypothetical protein